MRLDFNKQLIDTLMKVLQDVQTIEIIHQKNNPYLPQIKTDKIIFGATMDDVELIRNWVIGNGIDFYDIETLKVFDNNPIMKDYTLSVGVEFVFNAFKAIVYEISQQLNITIK